MIGSKRYIFVHARRAARGAKKHQKGWVGGLWVSSLLRRRRKHVVSTNNTNRRMSFTSKYTHTCGSVACTCVCTCRVHVSVVSNAGRPPPTALGCSSFTPAAALRCGAAYTGAGNHALVRQREPPVGKQNARSVDQHRRIWPGSVLVQQTKPAPVFILCGVCAASNKSLPGHQRASLHRRQQRRRPPPPHPDLKLHPP